MLIVATAVYNDSNDCCCCCCCCYYMTTAAAATTIITRITKWRKPLYHFSNLKVKLLAKHLNFSFSLKILNTFCRLTRMMMQCMGIHRGAMATERGSFFTPDEALKVGLVDKVVPKNDLLKAAEKEMGVMIGVPGIRCEPYKICTTLLTLPVSKTLRPRLTYTGLRVFSRNIRWI